MFQIDSALVQRMAAMQGLMGMRQPGASVGHKTKLPYVHSTTLPGYAPPFLSTSMSLPSVPARMKGTLTSSSMDLAGGAKAIGAVTPQERRPTSTPGHSASTPFFGQSGLFSQGTPLHSSGKEDMFSTGASTGTHNTHNTHSTHSSEPFALVDRHGHSYSSPSLMTSTLGDTASELQFSASQTDDLHPFRPEMAMSLTGPRSKLQLSEFDMHESDRSPIEHGRAPVAQHASSQSQYAHPPDSSSLDPALVAHGATRPQPSATPTHHRSRRVGRGTTAATPATPATDQPGLKISVDDSDVDGQHPHHHSASASASTSGNARTRNVDEEPRSPLLSPAGDLTVSRQQMMRGTGHSDSHLSEAGEVSMDGYISSPSQSATAESFSTMFDSMPRGGHHGNPAGASPQLVGVRPDGRGRGSATPGSRQPTSPPQRGGGGGGGRGGVAVSTVEAGNIDDLDGSLHIFIPPLSVDVQRVMQRAAHEFELGSGEVSAIVEATLGADMSNFRKIPAVHLLRDLVVVCGVLPLRAWLEQYKVTSLDTSDDLPPGAVGAAVGAGGGNGGPTSSSASFTSVELEVKDAVILLGELACQMGLLKSKGAGDGQDTFEPYPLIQLCLLLRLCAGAWDGGSGRMKLVELVALLEDAWLSSRRDDGIKMSLINARARCGLLLQV